MALVFEQQPRESDRAFAGFSLYLSLGPQRSLAMVGKKLGKSEGLIERWSAKYDWPARVQAHAAHLAAAELEASEALSRTKGVDWVKRQQEHREEEWRVRCELIEVARIAIARWKQNAHRSGNLEGIARLLELASKLGRLATGMATDRTEVEAEETHTLRIEVQAALDKIYGQPLPGEVVEVEEVKPAVEAALPAPGSLVPGAAAGT